MARIDAELIDRAYRQLSSALRRWEESQTLDATRALEVTASQTQVQIAAWESAGVWEGVQMRLLHDTVAHVGARLEMARQAAGCPL